MKTIAIRVKKSSYVSLFYHLTEIGHNAVGAGVGEARMEVDADGYGISRCPFAWSALGFIQMRSFLSMEFK
jgi:hypothetical protein